MDIKLKDFEGPLDLLLHLVSKYEMDIYDVPIVEVIEQYLAYISTLKAMRLEVAGEYMVMASQLMLIKSRKLLPKVVEETPIEEDPEQVLLSQIEEYRQFKALSQELAAQHEQRAKLFSKPKQELIDDEAILEHDKTTLDLYLAFSKVMATKQEELRANHTTIERDDYRIEDMMAQVQARLADQDQVQLQDIFEEAKSINEVITLFLATLELIKIHQIRVLQEENFGGITLMRMEEGVQA